MTRKIKVYKDVFVGGIDECERMIGCLQYCAFLPIRAVENDHDGDQADFTPENLDVQPFFEKGSLYREMITNLQDFSLIDQCFYIIQKFTEFHERVEMVDVEIEFKEVELDQLVFSFLNRIKAIMEYQLQHCSLLKMFYVIKISRVLIIFHLINHQTRDCTLIVISQDVVCLPIRLADLLKLLDTVSNMLHQLLSVSYDEPTLYLATLASLLRDVSTIDYAGKLSEEQFDERQLYDEQFIDLYEFLQDSKKSEAIESIESLRNQIQDMLDEVASDKEEHEGESEPENSRRDNVSNEFNESNASSCREEENIMPHDNEFSKESFPSPTALSSPPAPTKVDSFSPAKASEKPFNFSQKSTTAAIHLETPIILPPTSFAIEEKKSTLFPFKSALISSSPATSAEERINNSSVEEEGKSMLTPSTPAVSYPISLDYASNSIVDLPLPPPPITSDQSVKDAPSFSESATLTPDQTRSSQSPPSSKSFQPESYVNLPLDMAMTPLLPPIFENDSLFSTQTIVAKDFTGFATINKGDGIEGEVINEKLNSGKDAQKISSSLYANLLASNESEDVFRYAQRAYSAIRNKYVDEALVSYYEEHPDFQSLLSIDTSQRLSVIATSAPTSTNPYPADLAVRSHSEASEEKRGEKAGSAGDAMEENNEEEEEGKTAFLALLDKHRDSSNYEGEEINLSEPTIQDSRKQGPEQVRILPSTLQTGNADNPLIVTDEAQVESFVQNMAASKVDSVEEVKLGKLDIMRMKAAAMIYRPEESASLLAQVDRLYSSKDGNAGKPPVFIPNPLVAGTPGDETPLVEEEMRRSSFHSSPLLQPKEPDLVQPITIDNVLADKDDTPRGSASPLLAASHRSPSDTPRIAASSFGNSDLQLTLNVSSANNEESTMQDPADHVRTDLSTGRSMKHAVLLDQLNHIQSTIEYDYMQRRIEKNRRRVKIGTKIIQLLKQQKLLPPNYEEIMIAGTGTALQVPFNADNQRKAEKVTMASLPSRTSNRVKDFPPFTKETIEESFFQTSHNLDDPSEGIFPSKAAVVRQNKDDLLDIRKIASFIQDDQLVEIHAQPRPASARRSPVPSLAPGASESTKDESIVNDNPQQKNKPTVGGVVWNIDTADRPKSRVSKSFIIPRKVAGGDSAVVAKAQSVEDIPVSAQKQKALPTTTIVDVASEGLSDYSSPQKPKPLPRPHSATDMRLNKVASPQNNKKESDLENPAVLDGQKPPAPAQRRSASAQRASRPVSRNRKNNPSSLPLPTTKSLSNYTQTRNAINYVCLAGAHQEEKRNEVLDLLEYYHLNKDLAPASDALLYEEFKGQVNHFILLFYKAKSLAFKSIYLYDTNDKRLIKVFGKGGPGVLSDSDPLIKEFMKFETSSKSFKTLPVKAISSTIDAIIIEPPKSKNLPL